MKKTILILILSIFISGCAGQIEQIQKQDTQIQDDSSKEISPSQERRQMEDCDGICDNFEKEYPESPCHKPDCLGISEPKKEEIIHPKDRMHPPQTFAEISVEKTGSTYKTTTEKPTGWFTNNQNADILLSGVDFNNAGGPLFFNHQGGIATDGNHLILADRNNNRVLIWNTLPEGNTAPDIVLGQKDFTTNNPGKTLDKLNWPVGVATDGKHLLVADTYNHRILIWNSFPTENGQAADVELQGSSNPDAFGSIGWPWAVWTNGNKMVVTSTTASQVLIWNAFPTENNQKPDIILKLDEFGTPRSIGSNGNNLIIGDHNAFKTNQGNFFWKTFPTKDNQKYDFFMENTKKSEQIPQNLAQGEVFWGPTFTQDGKLIVLGDKLHIWDKFPEDENDMPDISIGGDHGISGYDFGGSQGGDGSGIAIAGEKLFISLSNGNKIVGLNKIPTKSKQEPDFVIGSPDIYTNTLETNFIMSNPIPATDGKSLFVSSDFDRKLYVWKSLPDESGAKPDFVYDLPDAPWDNALYDNVLALAGKQTVFIWKRLPLNGEKPDVVFTKNIGNIKFNELSGIAIDEKYFYLSDANNKVYVWEGIPEKDSEPIFTLDGAHSRISSDGKYLVAASFEGPGGSVKIYKINELPNGKPAILGGMFNLPGGVLIYESHLFVGDTGFNAVHIWNNIEDAIAGKDVDILLGEKDYRPQIGRNKLFFPTVPAFDGSYLWVGEFKFSERLLRFSVKE